ncbi:hypothetical protein KKC88_03485 [Patescibacteria group bacterium]|nr:hypothetical protein [Patescibacteria group bacterium]MBU1673565.1 hypothetical protein [Patescibacteria group bacterium]MBU1963643.1 hypothetical protein [Patescibacteria group bacterium]
MTTRMMVFLAAFSLAATCLPANAQERYAQFLVMEDLPDGFVAWQFSFTKDTGLPDMKIAAGKWSDPILVSGKTPSILVGVCAEDDCGHIEVKGEIPALTLSEPEGETLISNLIFADWSRQFEIKLRWVTPPPTPPPPSSSK